MAKKTDFDTALKRFETAIDAMALDGIPRETALDAAAMLALGEAPGAAVIGGMRAIVQLPAPETDQERSKTLHRMYQGFSLLLMARGYPLAQIATASLSWGHGMALNSVGPDVTAETLRMLADSSRAEGVN